jgi:hypothetical protein
MLVFVHIPKTAGTTLHKVISHQYRPKDILIRHDSDGPISETLASWMGDPPKVVMGHYSVGLHQYVPGVRYITCLREPVARLISHYHYASGFPGHYLYDTIHRDKLDLAGYVSSGIAGELSNGMTRMLAGVQDCQASVGGEALALAKRHIEEYFDVAILNERFDEGLLLLGQQLGWATPYYFRRKVGHYSAAAANPDARTRQAILEFNALDVDLYEWAKERFDRQASVDPALARRTQRFQSLNRHWGKAVFLARELRSRLNIS